MESLKWILVVALAALVGAFVFFMMSPVPPSPAPEAPPQEIPRPEPQQPEEEPPAEEPGGLPTEALKIDKIQSFPETGHLLAGGSAALHVTLASDRAGTSEVALVLDGSVVETQSVALEAGQPKTLRFELEDLDVGEHTIEILDRQTTLTVIRPATGDVPADGQVITDEYGLDEAGIPGGKLVVTTFGEGPKTLNPATAAETSSTDITSLMHAALFDINPMTGELIPGLAESWEIGPGGKSVTLYLRRGLRWSDGEPFTADDVVFTYRDVIGNTDVNSNARDGCIIGGEFVEIEKLDDYTVKASVVEPFRPLLRNCLGSSILPEHKLARYVAKLNPGAQGDLEAIESTVNNSREDLEKADAEVLAALDEALGQLSQAVRAQDPDRVETAAQAVKEDLDRLGEALGAGDVADALEQAKDYVDRAVEHARDGRWVGVAPGTFNNTWTTSTPPEEFAGLGPYVLEDYQTDQQILLRRNPRYWRVDVHGVRLPYLDQLAVLIVQDIETQFLYFKNGQSDMYGARPEDWAEIVRSAEENGWRTIKDGPGYGTQWVAVNQDIAKLKPDDSTYQALQIVTRTKEFRQALSYAIDRGAMIDNIYRGLGEPQWTDVSMPSPFYAPEAATTYPYNPEKAEQMLDGLQLVDTDGDGTRNIADEFLIAQGACRDEASCRERFGAEGDREVSFPLATNVGNTIRETLAQQIEHDWKQIGLGVTYRPAQFNALVTDLFGGQFGAILLGLTGGVDPAGGLNVWRTDGYLHFWRYSSKDDPPDWERRIEELMEEGAKVFDVEEAVERYYKEFQRLVSEYLPLIYLVNGQFLYAVDRCLTNSENFRPQSGNSPQWVAFGDRLWWQRSGGCESKLEQKGRISASTVP